MVTNTLTEHNHVPIHPDYAVEKDPFCSCGALYYTDHLGRKQWYTPSLTPQMMDVLTKMEESGKRYKKD